MLTRREALMGTVFAAAAVAVIPSFPAMASAKDVAGLPREKVTLVAPPFVHAHDQVAKGGPKVVEFTMKIEEKPMIIDARRNQLNAMTYNGSIPGPLMVVHEGDYLELTLINPETQHARPQHRFPCRHRRARRRRADHGQSRRTGHAALQGNPCGHVRLSLRARRPDDPVACRVGHERRDHGLPRDGLKNDKGEPVRYDQIYYVGENDFYIPRDEQGDFKRYESAGDGYEEIVKVMRGLIPTHVVFNGAVGSLTGDNAMKAKVGETVLIVHSQANRDTRPHLIGGHGDYVWEQGKFANPPAKDLETWFIRGGSAGAALYTFLQPGIYAYVNHNLIEAVELGATAHFTVDGEWDDDLMTQVDAPRAIVGL